MKTHSSLHVQESNHSRKLQRDRWLKQRTLSSSILQTSLHRRRKQGWLLQQSVMLTSESWLL